MKLDRLVSGALFAAGLAATCALAGGCSNAANSASVKTASATLPANAENVIGTTNLMSAQIPGPAPKVGKAHLAVDDESATDSDSELLPKEARRSDGSRRGGGFGSYSK